MKFYLVLSACYVLAFGKSISNFPQCKISDQELEKCIIEGIEAIRPTLKDGIPEINLPPLDPFKMDLLNIDTSITGATVKATVTNIVAHGGSDFKIKNFKVDLDNKYTADLKIILPRLDVTADYNTRGSRMLFIQLNGRGKFKGSFTGVAVEVKCIASPVVKDGVKYLQLDSITTKVSIENADLNVTPQESDLSGRIASSFASASPSLILNVLSPAIDEAVAPVVKQILDSVLAKFPLDIVLID